MKQQTQQEIADILKNEPEKLDEQVPIVFRETETFMILDIKSKQVRKDDEEGMTQTEAANAKYSVLKESKITSADNFGPRGVNTLNLILKSKLVQETAPASIENAFQATEWDIYDHFADAEPVDDGEDKDLKIDDKELAAAAAEAGEGGAGGSQMGQSEMSGNEDSMAGMSTFASGTDRKSVV